MLSTMIKKWRGERPSIFILSGAGLSVESGIPTYRGEGSDPKNDSASLSRGYMRSLPERVFEAANQRIHDFDACEPNAAHKAIAKFIKKYRLQADIVHVTQNIDSLCEEAGDTAVFHLHGSLNRVSARNAVRFSREKASTKWEISVLNAALNFQLSDPMLFSLEKRRMVWIGSCRT